MLAHDSNVTRTEDPVADWTESLTGGVGYVERTTDLNARLLAQVERRHYLRGTFQDDTRYFANGAALWTISPQQLSWAVEDVAADALLNPTAQDTPTNRTKTNFLSTGPEFTFRVNPADMPVLGARYGRYDIEGPGDNQRYSGYARWVHKLSELEKLSFNYETMRVDFAPPTSYPNFLRQDEYLRYERISALDGISVDGGVARTRLYGGESTTGRLVRVTASHTLNSESAIKLLLSDQISDSATDLIRNAVSATATGVPTAPVQPGGPAVTTGDTYRSQGRELTYLYQNQGIAYTLLGFLRHVHYLNPTQITSQDRREAGGRFTLTWTQSGAMRVYAYTDFMKRTFPGLDERDIDRNSALGASYLLTPRVSFTSEIGRLARNSTGNSTATSLGFVDTRAMLFLGYSTGPLYSTLPRR